MTAQSSGKRLATDIALLAVALQLLVACKAPVSPLTPQAAELPPSLPPRLVTAEELYAQRQPHPDDIERTFTAGGGDLFVAQPGSVAPPPNPDEVLARYYVGFDEDGFRRPIWEADHYPIIVFGTSMSEGLRVAVPWPDLLASHVGIPVQNMAVSTYNPPDYAQVMRLYGTRESHDWVIVSFFEGQDLSNSIVDRPEDEFVPPDVVRDRLSSMPAQGDVDYGEGPWKYPIEMVLAGETRPLAFFEFYLWQLNGLPEDYQNSAELAALRGHLASIQSDAGDACVMLVYMPIKPHVYLPFVTDPTSQTRVIEAAFRVVLEDGDRLGLFQPPETFEGLLGRLDNMSVVIGRLAEEMGIYFVNVTGAFQEAAARGEETYFTYDTHMNQRAHEITAQVVADAISQHPECQSRSDAG